MSNDYLSNTPLPGFDRGYSAVTLMMLVHLDAERDEWQLTWTLMGTGEDSPIESVALPPVLGIGSVSSIALRCRALVERALEALDPF